jgi:hypothetical protein
MTVVVNKLGVRINHPLLGKGDLVGEIGPISVELMIWLKAKRELDVARRLAANPDDVPQYGQFLSSQKDRVWDHRCRWAATKIYKPRLADELGNLTENGQAKANYVIEKLQSLRDILNEEPDILDIDKWTQADQVIAMGTLSLRQAKMLRVIHNAIIDAERMNREYLDREYRSQRTEDERRRRQIAQLAEEPQLAAGFNLEQASLALAIEAEKSDESVQQLQGVVIDGGPNYGRKGFVPTAPFSQKTRNDLAALLRFGLLDLSALVNAGRGRPKHVVRLSRPGQVLLEHVIRLGLPTV